MLSTDVPSRRYSDSLHHGLNVNQFKLEYEITTDGDVPPNCLVCSRHKAINETYFSF